MNAQVKVDFSAIFAERVDWLDVLDGSTILITGISGVVGSSVANAVLFYNEKYHTKIKLVGLCRDIKKAAARFHATEGCDNPLFIEGDVCNPASISVKLDYIIHCANTTSSKAYVDQPIETINTIVNGTGNMLALAAEHHTKMFIYMSSMEIYGAPDNNGNPLTEDSSGYIDCLSVRSSYSEGKRMAECLCAAYLRECGVSFKVARLAQVFGAGSSLSDGRVFMQLTKSALHGTPFVMHTTGESYGNYCYTADAAAGVLMLLSKGNTGEAYNIVNENNCMMIKDMAELVSRKVAAEPFDILFDIPASALTYGYAPQVKLFLSAKKMNSLGWFATVSLPDMYKKMIASFNEGESLTK